MTSIEDDTRWLDATDQARLVREGKVSARELAEAAINRITAGNPQLNAVNYEWFDHGRELATAVDRDKASTAFAGVPFLLKDLHTFYAGFPISNGNKAMKAANYTPNFSTTLVERFAAQRLVFLGRTTSPEWGSVPVTEPEAWGISRNPWNLDRTCGGSSGGSAAAVATGMVPIAHASDGGGSVRIPASCCGLVGLKVSQGRITVGPTRLETNLGVELCVSRSVRDTAAILDAVHGPGVGDLVIAPPPTRPYVQELGAPTGRLRIGFATTRFTGEPIHPDCVEAVTRTAALLDSLGHHVEPAVPAALDDPRATARFSALWATNMAANRVGLADLLGRPVTIDDVELMNWSMAEYATRLSALDYSNTISAAGAFRREVARWWTEGWDLLLTPTLSAPPLPVGTSRNNPADPGETGRIAIDWAPFTAQFNTTGQPAISLPMHWSDEGLPIGVQLVAAYAREDVLIRVASQLESAAPWAQRHPNP
ncbi:MAG: amidase [Actinobacteria bacterium]|nr:amidase [Actinomycetota bacterium]